MLASIKEERTREQTGDRTANAVRIADDRRVVHAGDAIVFQVLERLRAQGWREVDQIVGHLQERTAVRRRLGREGLRRRRLLAGHVGLRHRTLLERPYRLSGDPIEHVEEALLARLRDRLHGPAVHRDVGEQRRRRHVEVPDRMVDDLIVPFALAGFQVDAHQAVAEQVVARTMTAVQVRRGIFNRQIHEPELLVDGNLRPDARVAVDRPRFLLPGIVAEVARLGNRVERPQQLAALRVPRAHQPLGVVVGLHRQPFAERRADDDRVLGDRRRRVEPDLAALEIDLLSLADHGADLHVDDAVLPERRDGDAGLRVERDEAIAGRDVDDAIVALAVGPVREAAARELPRRVDGARAFLLGMHPDQLAGLRVERDHRSPRAAGRVDHALHHQRRPLELELGARAEVVGFEAPRNLELVEPLFSGESTQTTLFYTLDACCTPMGKRLLRSTLLRPSSDLAEIESRLEAVAEAAAHLPHRLPAALRDDGPKLWNAVSGVGV